MTAIPKPGKRKRSVRPERLTGAALEKLRRDCFERDSYRCQHVIRTPICDLKGYTTGMSMLDKCANFVSWESGHMAHIIARSLGGADSLENIITKCADCHLRREHTMGEK